MAIPDFQSLMLPVLKFFANKKEHSIRETIEGMATALKLSAEEQQELLPSGKEPIFDNRIRWTVFYLTKSQLLIKPRRGVVKITPRGSKVLKENPKRIDIKFLKQFSEYREFREKIKDNKSNKKKTVTIEPETIQTPQESLEYGHQKLKDDLAQELIKEIKSCSPIFFEWLVVELLVKLGYGGSIKEAGQIVGKSGDEGIDGIIKEDKLGLDVIYIQAKRWENTVGRPEIQKFAGALQGKRAKKGIFITTAGYTKEAKNYVSNIESKIILIDGDELAELMIDNNIGVSFVATYEVKKLDTDYFEEA